MSFGLMIQEPNVSWLLNTTFCGSFHVPTCLKNTCENPKPREKDFVAPLPGLCAHSQNLLCPRCHRDRIIMSFKAFNSCSDFFLHDLFPSLFYIPNNISGLEAVGWIDKCHCLLIKRGRIWAAVQGREYQPQNTSLLSGGSQWVS